MEIYSEYDELCNQNEKRNEKYLILFKEWLEKQNLSENTVYKHVSNIEFFANVFLTSYEIILIEDGFHYISDYLGYWFLRKAMWSSISSINENCASFKKFYKCMLENGFINEKNYLYVCETIKKERKDWHQTYHNMYDTYELEG